MSDLPPVLIDLAPQPKEEQKQTCPLCSEEMIKNEEGRAICPSEHLHRKNPTHKELYDQHKWFGQIREHVKSKVTWKDEPLNSPIQRCPKCDASVDFNSIIDLEGGVALAMKAVLMDKLGELRKQWTKLQNKRPKLNLFEYEVEKERLFAQFQELEIEGAYTSHTENIQIRCLHCHVPLGKVKIDLEVIEPSTEAKPQTWDSLYQAAKNIPAKIGAKVAHELGYQSFNSLTSWADSSDLLKLSELTAEYSSKFDALEAPDHLAYNFSKELHALLNDIPKEINRRKQVVVEKIQYLAKQEAVRR